MPILLLLNAAENGALKLMLNAVGNGYSEENNEADALENPLLQRNVVDVEVWCSRSRLKMENIFWEEGDRYASLWC